MKKQPPTERMVLRARALSALESAILPGFCEGMTCDKTCPYWRVSLTTDRNPVLVACVWIKTYRAIEELKDLTEKYTTGE
jgi:hypothetical protein